MKLKTAGYTVNVKDFGFKTDVRLVAVKIGAHNFTTLGGPRGSFFVQDDTFTFTTKGATMKAVKQLIKEYSVPVALIQVDQMNVVIL